MALATGQLYAQVYMAKSCEISFLSPTPVENIAAVNKKTIPFLNTGTGDLQMKITMTAFVFEKPLMQEHFNENYVESEKYPHAIFKGKINEKIDYTEDGKHDVTCTGKMNIHGVEKDVTIKGTLTVDMNKVILASTFRIAFADYKIVIPELQKGVIPDDTEVKINATLEPYKKN